MVQPSSLNYEQLFLCLNVTIVIILEGYAQAQEERAVVEKGDLADLCSYDIFTQVGGRIRGRG
jgi:hypothetical protein